MNRVALALSALLFAACEIPIASSSIDAGSLDASGLECEENPCLNGGTCSRLPDGFRCSCPAGYEGALCETDVNDCSPNPCKNNGVCSDQVAGYSCECAQGFTGVDCSADIDECADQPCENGGTCTDLANGYQCDCAAGFSGSRCEVNIDDCSTMPCANDGECQDEVNGFTCICKVGNTGPTCSNLVETCGEGTCKNGGTCQDGESGFTCTCVAGYNGVTCDNDIDDCGSLPCQNGANCVDEVNGYECQCPDGYVGVNCENLIDPCNPNPCQNTGSCTSAGDYYVCSCPEGYNGVDCEHNIDDCASNPCGNGGSCTDQVHGFMCTCLQGFSGPTCNNEPANCPLQNPCGHGECKDGVNGYTCDCDAGFTGATCSDNVDDCGNNPCGAHGSCADGDNTFICTCATGYEGPTCQTDKDDCEAVPCKNAGTCHDLVNGFTCDCAPGWGGDTCEGEVDECNPNPCLNGGSCDDEVNDYTCTCVPGYQGDNCEIDECSLVGACGNGMCDGHGGCICDSGWEGTRCDQNIDECTTANPCLHSGSCEDSPGSFSCTCTTGYRGVICESCAGGYQDNDDDGICCADGYAGTSCTACDEGFESVNGLCKRTCTSSPIACGDHGMCDDSGESPTCLCESSYFGPVCDSLMGTCSGEPCGQHGDCTMTSETTHQCTCDAGYIGRSCELVDECALAVVNNVTLCQNGGMCVDGDNTNTCICTSGWTGADCSQVDDCVVNVPQDGPCSGHGTCADGNNAYTCTCSTGWLGTTCAEEDNCVANGCQHGSVCHDATNTYTCDCTNTGYAGNLCENKIDYCQGGPCLNGGVCSDIGLTYSCDCTGTGFSGPTCNIDIDECADVQADVCAQGECANTANGYGFTCQCPDGTMDLSGNGTECAPVASLSAGALNTCAITTAGSLHCWGDNSFGQLGQGSLQNPQASQVRTPLRVGTGTGWTKVSVGNAHVCGVRNGHLFCWGKDDRHQVGGGTSAQEPSPFELRPDLTWTDVSAGAEHTCALAGTALYCWGYTADLQVGTATTTTPVAIVDAPRVVTGTWNSVSAGGYHTCAINSANQLSCWGRSSSGQLGGTQPVAAPQGTWSSVKAGMFHTCAQAGANTYCWGAGSEGALGNGAYSDSTSPVLVSGGHTLAALAGGENFGCGLVNAGDAASTYQIYCWGTNVSGLLLTADAKVNVPQVVSRGGAPAWTAYAVGKHHMCGVDNGLVYCWGSNADGAVGSAPIGSTLVTTASLVKGGAVVHSRANNCDPNPCHNGGACTATPTGFTCACGGTGFSGATCTTESDECSANPTICGQGTCHDVLDGDGYSCSCPDGLIDVDNTGTTCASAETLAGGPNHTCLLTTAKTLHCWGSNRYGQFGLGTVGTTDYYPHETSQTIRTPLRLKTVSGLAANVTGWNNLVVGEKHTCATRPTGVGAAEGLYCWGDNTSGQVGIAVPAVDPKTSPAPVLLNDTQTWTSLTAGFSHTCGVASGALYCWGFNPKGQLGNGSFNATVPVQFSLSTPVPLPNGETTWVAVAGGGNHTCAIAGSSTMYCWGSRSSGQTGGGSTAASPDILVPTKVVAPVDPQGYSAVAADLAHTCALVGTSAYCWGAGTQGAIGNAASLSVNSPTAAAGGFAYSRISTGQNFACGLIPINGSSPQAYTARCWGNNSKNLLQTGSTTNVNTPTLINTVRQWRTLEVFYSHICGVDNGDGKLYCWGDNGLEGGVGQGKLGRVAASLLGSYDLGAIKTASESHVAP